MAGPGDEIAAGAGGRGQLRASHADREQVIETLKVAFVQGMLDGDEFDLRVGQAFASRTCAELAALAADLPVRLAVAKPLRPARTRDEIMQRPGRMMAVATAAYAGVWAYGLFLAPHGGDNQWVPALIIGGFLFYSCILLIGVVNMAVLRREKRSGGQSARRSAPGAGNQTSPRPLSADPGERLPSARHGDQHTAEAARSRRPRLPLPVHGHGAAGALAAGTAQASC
jgi:hypothetical protein